MPLAAAACFYVDSGVCSDCNLMDRPCVRSCSVDESWWLNGFARSYEVDSDTVDVTEDPLQGNI